MHTGNVQPHLTDQLLSFLKSMFLDWCNPHDPLYKWCSCLNPDSIRFAIDIPMSSFLLQDPFLSMHIFYSVFPLVDLILFLMYIKL
jgi:hypothetical protein